MGFVNPLPLELTTINSQIIMALVNQLAGRSDFKVEITDFKGEQDPDILIDWV